MYSRWIVLRVIWLEILAEEKCTMRFTFFHLSFIVLFSALNLFASLPASSSEKGNHFKKFKEKCWPKDKRQTLSGLMQALVRRPLETTYQHNNYVQTFGCAYEDDDIEQNSIRAVCRAIDQSLRNRGVVARENLAALMHSRPPRPDNLLRDYTIYVKPVGVAQAREARYEIRILDLEVVQTFESQRAVYTRVITRYSYQEDFRNSKVPVDRPSEFVEVMLFAEKIIKEAGKGKFKKIAELIDSQKDTISQVNAMDELYFGDYLGLFLENEPDGKEYPAYFLGNGIYIADIPDHGTRILKFGEEQLFGMQLDVRSFRRTTKTFVQLQYHAPESLLQCLLLRYDQKKPLILPVHQRYN